MTQADQPIGRSMSIGLLVGGYVVAVALGLGIAFGIAQWVGFTSVPSFIVFGLPVVIYAVVQRFRGDSISQIMRNLGLTLGNASSYLLVLLGTAIIVAGGIMVRMWLFPTFQTEAPPYSTLAPAVRFPVVLLSQGLNVAFGEELLFRGLLGLWAMRRFGFWIGNVLQSAAFTAIHLPLLTRGMELWPLLIVVFVFGIFFGWITRRSHSILPAWLGHTAGNTFTQFFGL